MMDWTDEVKNCFTHKRLPALKLARSRYVAAARVRPDAQVPGRRLDSNRP